MRSNPRLAGGVATGAAMIIALILVTTVFSPSSARTPSSGPVVSAAQARVLANPGDYQARDLAFSPDGTTIAASLAPSGPSSVLADAVDQWKLAVTQSPAQLTKTIDNTFGGLAFRPKSLDELAVAGGTGLDLWNLAPAKAVKVRTYVAPNGAAPVDVDWTPDGKAVAVFTDDALVYLLDVAKGGWSRPSGPVAAGQQQIAVSPDGQALAAADSAGNVYLWHLSGHAPWAIKSGAPQVIKSGVAYQGNHVIAFSPGGKTLAIAGKGEIRLLNVATGTYSAPLATPGTSPQAVAFAPNGASLAATDAAGHIDFWDLPNRKATTVKVPDTDLTGLAFSDDGKTLAAFGSHADRNVYLYLVRYAAA